MDDTAVNIIEFSTLTNTQVINTILNCSQQVEHTPNTTQQIEPDHQTTQNSQRLQITNDNPKNRIKWPASNMKKEWSQFESDAVSSLNVILKGTAERKMEAMSKIIYTMGFDRFGPVKMNKAPPQPQQNQRQQKIAKIRSEIRQLTKRYKEANDTKKEALAELRDDCKLKLKRLRQAECNRKQRKKRNQKRSEFIRNPFKFTKKLLNDKTSGDLVISKEEIEKHIKTIHSDPERHINLPNQEKLIKPDLPTIQFDETPLTIKEVRAVVKKARAGSAPGPNGIPYKVYKMCDGLLRILYQLLKVHWSKRKLAKCNMSSEGISIPKEENSTTKEQFRTVSLLNVEIKIPLAVLSRRITNFWISNKFIDTAVQKGGIPGVSGCIEHTSVLTQQIKEAKENKTDLAVLWLDLANAFGSIPHKLIEITLRTYHIPESFTELIMHYYDNFKIRFSLNNFTTSWQKLEIGIITGCTLSMILFAGAMNLILNSVQRTSRGQTMKSGIIQPPSRAFVDDMTLITKSAIEARWSLEELVKMIEWARMRFKPSKSRSMTLKKGKVDERMKYRIGQEVIPTITEKPIKGLGKWYRAAMSDRESICNIHTKIAEWMKEINSSGLPGRFKLWMYQHGVLPRLTWPFTVYTIPITEVEKMEVTLNKHIKQWLGIPRTFSSIGLYSTSSKLQLPLKSVTDEYKTTKARQTMTIRSNPDPFVREAGISLRSGRKWNVDKAVDEAQARLRQKDLIGSVAHGRMGIGCIPRQSWSKSNSAQQRHLVQDEIREIQEEQRTVRAAAMSKQGSWLNWEGVRPRKLNWEEMRSMEACRIKFLLASVYEVLPTPSNLCLWKLTETPNCKLCDKPANLFHILSHCPTALTDGRYTWRHNKVLTVLAHYFALAIKQSKPCKKHKPTFITFVKEGQKNRNTETGLLAMTDDWELLVDLKPQLVFPPEITSTSSRPDIVIWSKNAKTVIIIELTIPWEENVEAAHERKMLKYQGLTAECRERGWKTWCMAIEVGCRGFAGQSLWRCARTLGIIGKLRKDLVRNAERQAEESSRWIWNRRDYQWMSKPLEQETKPAPKNQSTKPQYPLKNKKTPRKPKTWIRQSHKVNNDTLFFFGFRMPFSNFHKCSFFVDLPSRNKIIQDAEMHSVEQLYMYRKSYYFQDHDTCKRILEAADAVTTKRLSKFIKGFDPVEWRKVNTDIMVECLTRKFTDSDKSAYLTDVLLNSPHILVEASPDDSTWGIGFSKEQGPYILKENWEDGENLLGKLLMSLRQFIINKSDIDANFSDPYNYNTVYRKVQRRTVFAYCREEYSRKETPQRIPFRVFLQQQ